jgi:hypothetical protein
MPPGDSDLSFITRKWGRRFRQILLIKEAYLGSGKLPIGLVEMAGIEPASERLFHSDIYERRQL